MTEKEHEMAERENEMAEKEAPRTVGAVLLTVLRDILVYWKIFVLILTPVLLLPLPLMLPSQVSDRGEAIHQLNIGLLCTLLQVIHLLRPLLTVFCNGSFQKDIFLRRRRSSSLG